MKHHNFKGSEGSPNLRTEPRTSRTLGLSSKTEPRTYRTPQNGRTSNQVRSKSSSQPSYDLGFEAKSKTAWASLSHILESIVKDIVSVKNMAKFRVPHFYPYHTNIVENISIKSLAMMIKKR